MYFTCVTGLLRLKNKIKVSMIFKREHFLVALEDCLWIDF